MFRLILILFAIFLSCIGIVLAAQLDDGQSQVYQAPDAFDFEDHGDDSHFGSALPKVKSNDPSESKMIEGESSQQQQQALNRQGSQEEPSSAVEMLYAERLQEKLHQFGYNIFSQGETISTVPMGAVQDDYVLGIGDEISLSFSGQHNSRERVKVDAQGMINIDDFPPITAAGLTLAQLRKGLEERAQGLHNTDIYVTLSNVRQIGVLVVGNVNKPGRKKLTIFNSVLDALILAEGVRKDGSLRQIKLVRSGQSMVIDLYDILLLGGTSQDFALRDGDRIVVPPIGATVAVTGAVKRPAIYEMRVDTFKGLTGTGKNKLTLRQMLALGGGVLGAGQNRFLHLSVHENGYEVGHDVSEKSGEVFSDGSVLVVARGKEMKAAQIQLLGQTRKPGFYDLARNKNLSNVLSDQQVLGENIYPLIGVIARWDSDKLSTSYLSYPVRAVLKKEKDFSLQDGDKIYLFSNQEIFNLYNDYSEGAARISNKFNADQNEQHNLQKNPALSSYLRERSVVVRGSVRQEGWYPVADDIKLDDVLAAAGGLARDADQTNIEITSTKNNDDEASIKSSRLTVDLLSKDPKSLILKPGDAIRVMQKYKAMEENGVLIIGQVKRPGRYDLLPADKISDLIKRAGGLTDEAYPMGAVFSRESERRAEQARFKAAKQDMEKSLAAALQKEKNAPDAAQIEMVRSLADELGNVKALGRVTIEANPNNLMMRPELDMLLEDGDKLYIPKRPLTVRVSGEVLSPASLQFQKDKEPLDYIQQAGGFTYHADKDRTFVLYPDGSAQPLQVNTWNHKPIKIPPGSTVIVPRDPKPFDFMESARDFTQILSNLAVTSILVDDLQE